MVEEHCHTIALPLPSAIAAGEPSPMNPWSCNPHQPTRLDEGNTLVSQSSPVISPPARQGWLEHLLYSGVDDMWVLLTSRPHLSVCVLFDFLICFHIFECMFQNSYLELGVSKWGEPNFVRFIMKCNI